MTVSQFNNFAPSFSYEELTHSDTAARMGLKNMPDLTQLANLRRLSWYLEALRAKLREKHHPKSVIIVTSGFRSPELNANIPGSSLKSAHMRGLAADIRVPGMTALELARFIEKHCLGYDQLINEFGQWVHLGLSEGVPRQQLLTTFRQKTALGFSKVVYAAGIHPVT